MGFLDRILELLRSAWPLLVVYEYQAGVRFRMGRHIATLGPGVYFRWWFFEEIVTVSVVEQSINLPTQSVALQDGTAVSFSANLTYEIADAGRYYCAVQDFERSLVDQAMIHLAARVRSFPDFASLHEAAGDLERSLRETTTTRVKRWGVKITGVGLTDLVHARTYRLLADPPQLGF